MRGYIKSRYTGTYTIVLNLGKDPATGKRKQQWVSIKGTKKDAEKRLAEMIHQIDTGTFMRPSKTTLAVFFEKWLTDYAKPNLAPRTKEGYENIIRCHLIPGLGNILLTQLKPEHITRYEAQKIASGRCDGKGGLSARSVRYHHFTLHTALRTAVKWGLLARNPTDAVDPPHFDRPEMHTLNEGDIQKLLAAAKDTQYYTLFFLALFTGMRRSELLALRWQDVDLLLCQAFVTRSMHQLRDGTIIFREPKTARSRRMISLSPSTAIELRDHYEKQKLAFAMQGLALRDDTLLFCQLDGKPLLPNSVTHAWIKLVRRLGLNGIRLHDARHSHASLMLKQGIHPKIVQERLGHSSITTTLDVYSHVAPGLQEAAANRFDELINLVPEKEVIKKER